MTDETIASGAQAPAKRHEWILETLKVLASLATPLIIFFLGQDLAAKDQARQASQKKEEVQREERHRVEDIKREEAQRARDAVLKSIEQERIAIQATAQAERDEKVRLAAVGREQAALDLEVRKQETLDDERIYAQQQAALQALTRSMFEIYTTLKATDEAADTLVASTDASKRNWASLRQPLSEFQKVSAVREPDIRTSLNTFRRFMPTVDFNYTEEATGQLSRDMHIVYSCYEEVANHPIAALSTDPFFKQLNYALLTCKEQLEDVNDCINSYSWSISGRTIRRIAAANKKPEPFHCSSRMGAW